MAGPPRQRERLHPGRLAFSEQVTAARDAALKLLGVRERSAAELRTRLKGKGFDPPAVEAALARLQEVELQSDERFAERFAQGALGRGLASARIRDELRARGVPPEVAAAATAASPEEEWERARALARARAGRMAGNPPRRVYERIAALLARRGYGAEVCRAVAGEVLQGELLDPDPDAGLR